MMKMKNMKIKVNQQSFIYTKIQCLKLLNLQHSWEWNPHLMQLNHFLLLRYYKKVLLKRVFAMKMDILFLKVRCMQKQTILKKFKKLWSKKIKDQRLRKPSSVFIYLNEIIFITNITIIYYQNLSLSMGEYQLILVDALSDHA